MPLIVSGKQFYQGNVPGPKAVLAFDFTVRAPIQAEGSGNDYGSARSKAQYLLAEYAGDADAVIDVTYDFIGSDRPITCVATGIPVKRLN